MIVELIGCAGAGKTTLRRMLCDERIPKKSVVAMSDLVRDRPLLRHVEHPTAVNVMQEVAGFPYFLGAWSEERAFFALARELLGRPSVSTFDRLNGLRGIVRKLGMYRLATRRASELIVLSDEGTVLSAYNLLVPTGVEFGRAEVETFLGLVPLPERIVYVRASIETLVERATSRSDPRRQHIGSSTSEIERDIRRTVELFDLIAASPALEDRVLVVENDDAAVAERRRLAGAVAAWLRQPGANRRAHDETTALTALAGV